MFFLLLAPIVIALQETWLLPTDPYNFSLFHYSLYRYDETEGERRNGGTALYINNDFVHDQLHLNTPLQAVACTVRLNGREIDICSIYIPPRMNNNTLERHLTALIAQFPHPFLLLGDFNAHSPLWGRDVVLADTRGEIIESFLDNSHLVLLNTRENTHFSLSHNSESAIDLSICSPQISTYFVWSVDSDIHHSDHYPINICTTFSVERDATIGSIPRWNLQRADWGKFQELCAIDHAQFHSPEHGIKFFTDTIFTAAQASVPLTTPSDQRKRVPWWSPAVAQAIAKRKRAFRQYLRNKTDATLLSRNQERARCRKTIREAKRASWQSFLTQLNHRTPLSKIWNLVRSLSGKRSFSSLPVLLVNNVSITEPQAIVNTIAQTIARFSSSQSYRPGFLDNVRREFGLPHDAFLSDNTERYNVPFSLYELNDAIGSTGNTSVGPDRLHYQFFRHLPDSTLQFLLHTLNDLWVKGVFPEAWKEAILIALPKPGKTRADPANYRPISLTSCLGKIFERMVGKRFSWFLEHNNLLSKYQSGFRKNHSTLDHVLRLETDIRKGFKFKKHTTAVFLDITRAYDMVCKPVLLFKLHRIGIRGYLSHYLVNFLSGGRPFQVRFRSLLSDTCSFENGLPQGSCLSPMLFNVMINDIFDTIPFGISYSLFADDCAIWCTDRDSEHSIPRLQNVLCMLDTWSMKNGCIFSPTKSAVMVFTKHTRMLAVPDLYLSGHVIPRLSSFKFLGIVLDSRLSMAKHVQHIKSKCARRLNLFRCIAGTDFGADRTTLLRLYRSLVLPVIEYGSLIYAGGSETALKKLDTIQNAFIRIATGAMKTSPISSLLAEAVTTPLYLRRMEQSLRYANKLMYHPDHGSYKSLNVLPFIHHNRVGPAEKRSGLTLASRLKKFAADLQFIPPQVIRLPKLTIAPWETHNWEVSFLLPCRKDNFSAPEVQQKFLQFQHQFFDFHFIFTDGSKCGDHVSNAVFFGSARHRIQHRLPDGASIYSAELHAVFAALQLADDRAWKKIVICIDSRSVVEALKSASPSSSLLISIYNHLHLLTDNGILIQFLWIPSHMGIYGNTQADKYAKEAHALPHITHIPTDYQTTKSSIRQVIMKAWQHQWASTAPHTQLRQIKHKIEHWATANRTNRHEEKVLARLRIGHTYYTHRYIFLQDARPFCVPCNCAQTVRHILLDCRQYFTERQQLIARCTRNNLPFTLATILGDVSDECHDALFSFLRDIHLMDKL